jgi:hypothetical protein
VKCRHMIWRLICSLLVALPLSGCDYGESNKEPVVETDTAITAREVPVTIRVLANDSDPDGDELTLVAWTQGGGGEVTLGGDGTLTYTPAEGFDGSDSFTYTVDDDHGRQATGTVTVAVLPEPGIVVGGTLYTIKDVSPEGVVDPVAWGVNDAEQIAASGVVEGDDVERPLFIDADGSIAGIFVPGTLGRAFGINNNSQISGFFFDAASDEADQDGELIGRSFVWDAISRSLVAIYEIPDAVSTTGFKINDTGIIVGQVQLAAPENGVDGEEGEDPKEGSTLGFIRAPDGTIVTFSVPEALNTFLGGINNLGQIVGGFASDASEDALLFGFIRNADAAFTTFSVPDENGNPLWTRADDVNDAGDSVGLFRPEAGDGAIQGFLRQADGTILRFILPGFEEVRLTDINNLGVISGFGIDAEGLSHAIVLTPTPGAPNTFFEDTEEGDEG